MVAVLAVVFVLPLSACGEKITTLNVNVSIYNTEDEKVEEPILLGDINGNNEIDSMDYVLIKRAYFGTFKFQ